MAERKKLSDNFSPERIQKGKEKGEKEALEQPYGKLSSMEKPDVYEKFDESLEDTDSKIKYVKEMKENLESQHPNAWKQLKGYLDDTIKAFELKKEAEQILDEEGDFGMAATLYEEAFSKVPSKELLREQVRNRLKMAEYFEKKGYYELAARDYEKAYGSDKFGEFPVTYEALSKAAKNWNKAGEKYEKEGEIDKAEDNYMKAFRKNKHDVEVLGNLVDLYSKKGDEKRAKDFKDKKDLAEAGFRY
ncbi:MAG: tetratricopeptide repeat protein [Candidatus Pacearchaeota archaeon]